MELATNYFHKLKKIRLFVTYIANGDFTKRKSKSKTLALIK